MDVFPKFIIETDSDIGDCLIISQCTYHKDMVINPSSVKGGGWWKKEGSYFILYGSSEDFGSSSFEDIKNCILKGNVFTDPYLVNSIANKFIFGYDFGGGNIVNINN